MDPNNNQQINQQPSVNAPQASQPEQVGNPVPKTDKKYLLYGALIGLVIGAVVGVAAFYMMFSPKKSADVAVVPTPAPQVAQEQEVVVNDESDLEGLIVGLAQADNTLDKELTSLEKDSDF